MRAATRSRPPAAQPAPLDRPASFRPHLTVANAMTTASLISGLAAVLEATRTGMPLPPGRLRVAAGLIIVSAVLDALDGPVARRRGTAGPFGADLDSLADVVAFGVAPAVTVYFAQLHRLPVAGLAICAAWCACAMWRLARFGLCARRLSFAGCPVPLAAVLIAILAAAAVPAAATAAVAAVLCALMVSNVPVPTWPGIAAAVRHGRHR
jgi:CDP-diacylglycerol---serine O-phosphatidyltransferase